MNRSIVEEALTKARDETVSVSQNNEDLDQILAELKTEITVIGCGGGGSNTDLPHDGRRHPRCKAHSDQYGCPAPDPHPCRSADPCRQAANPWSGAGSIPQIGEEAALENEQEIRAVVSGSDMVFITVGLGGGTGTVLPRLLQRLHVRKEPLRLRSLHCHLPRKVPSAWRMPKQVLSASGMWRTP